MAYGCEVYSSATKAILSILDPIHNAGIRLASGVFKSSPIASLLVDAGELPLDSCRQLLLVRYWYRVQRLPDSLTYSCVFNENFFCYYNNHPRSPTPFGFRISKLLDELSIPKVKIWSYKSSVVPPWNLPLVEEYCRYFSSTRNEMSDELIRLSFLEHISDHKESILAFTDGSKSDAGVGLGVIFPNFNRSGRLPDQSSIFTAECLAILTALKEIAFHPRQDYVICCDSISALQAIEHFNTTQPVVLEILDWLYLVCSRGRHVSFCWCPAQVGIVGNEEADSVAKAATSHINIIRCPLPVNDLYPIIRSVMFDAWQFFWDLENKKMSEIAKSVRPWKYYPMVRKHEVILARLRIGHSRLTHGFLMCRGPQPFCEDCIVPLTVRHLIIECPSLEDEREKYFSSFRNSDGSYPLGEILGSDFNEQKLFNFIKDIGIFKKCFFFCFVFFASPYGIISRGIIWGVLGGATEPPQDSSCPPASLNLPPTSPKLQEVTSAGFPLFLPKFKCVITLTSHLVIYCVFFFCD